MGGGAGKVGWGGLGRMTGDEWIRNVLSFLFNSACLVASTSYPMNELYLLDRASQTYFKTCNFKIFLLFLARLLGTVQYGP